MELRRPVVLVGSVNAPGRCQLTTGRASRTDDLSRVPELWKPELRLPKTQSLVTPNP